MANSNYRLARGRHQVHHRLYDPWAQREAWRKDPFFSKRNVVKGLFPGLGLATVAFIAMLGYEKLTGSRL
ncbi:hypothetical protein IWQ60_004469 [Tieghemiomyces parasiticus]|uniref:NADH-ubiquinone oxidoreductase B12 subunit n=1 Tax=Tieghemiomyces parasiticus TaxID=78921 RepID=A0A9W8DVI0_9FUNG|nr:hypothetical protein IWQ60_004645 [Tieghemiomyces parasiticus]KAJ1925607.1 hypothetical protein IWQ60_004469 [Tieghemiomyces parasiticus]